jgi:hypothetical protein
LAASAPRRLDPTRQSKRTSRKTRLSAEGRGSSGRGGCREVLTAATRRGPDRRRGQAPRTSRRQQDVPAARPPANPVSRTYVTSHQQTRTEGPVSRRVAIPCAAAAGPADAFGNYDETAITVAWTAVEARPQPQKPAGRMLPLKPIGQRSPPRLQRVRFRRRNRCPVPGGSPRAPAETLLTKMPVPEAVCDARIEWGANRLRRPRGRDGGRSDAQRRPRWVQEARRHVSSAAPKGLTAVAAEGAVNSSGSPTGERPGRLYRASRGRAGSRSR